MTDIQDTATIGHNNPPEQPFPVELAERHAGLTIRADALIGQYNALPLVVETPEQHENAVMVAKAISELVADIGKSHADEKAPLAVKTTAIDLFFLSRGLKGRVEPLKATISLRNGAYQDKLAEDRRKEREAEAKKQADAAAAKMEEAAKLEAAGRHTEAAVQMEGAQATEQHAAAIQSQAAAPQKDLGRSYVGGATSSLIVGAEAEIDIDQIDLEKLRPYLAVEHVAMAVRGLIKARKFTTDQLLAGDLKLKGLTFKRTTKAR